MSDGSDKKGFPGIPPLKEFVEQTQQVKEQARKRGFQVPQGNDHEHYANVFMVASTLYDFRLDFGRRGVSNNIDHRGDVTVFMSPEHLKEMTAILLRLISEYEQGYGEIPSVYEIEAKVTVKDQKQQAPHDQGKTFYN